MRLWSLIVAAALLAGSASAGDRPSLWPIDPECSWLHVLVYRSGVMARFGHNHVIRSNNIIGQVTMADTGAFAAHVRLPLNALSVDDADARKAEGSDFVGDIADRDRAATRRNMLGPKLLNAGPGDFIDIRTLYIEGQPPDVLVSADIVGEHFGGDVRFPATVLVDGRELTITGEVALSHSDLGLKPYSAALGMLKVRDEMTVRFHIVARSDTASRPSDCLSVRESHSDK